jgi:hypothetical protein
MVNGIGAEDLAYLAWEASKEQKVVVPASFDDFCKKLKATPEVVDGVTKRGRQILPYRNIQKTTSRAFSRYRLGAKVLL